MPSRSDQPSVVYALEGPLVAELLGVARRRLMATLAETRDLLAERTAQAPHR